MPNKLSRFWQELKRRRVIQVIFVYATAAFMILEAVDIVFPRLNFPDWTITFVMILLAIGFPIAVIFSWIFDYTPKGIMRTKSMEDIRASQRYEEKKDAINDYSILWSRIIPWSLTVIVAAAILLLWIFRWNNGSNELLVIRSVHVLAGGEILKNDDPGATLAFSPDGSSIVYTAYRNNTSFLYKRNMDEFGAERIEGTEGGYAPFFSPDGNWLGFFADGKLKKVSMLGGAPQVICDTYPGREGSWGDDDSIVFCDYLKRCMWQVSAKGGEAVQLTTAMTWSNEESEHSHLWPSILPGGRSFLYTIYHNAEHMSIASFSIESGESKTLIPAGSHARYIRTGHLVYVWKGDLLAVPFDLAKMEVTGQPIMVIPNVMMNAVNGLAHFNISEDGSLAYVPGTYEIPLDRILMVDLQGEYDTLNLPPGRYASPTFSPDGKSFLVTRLQERANIWLYGLERGTFRRLSEKEFESFYAIWSPDGTKVVLHSNRHGGTGINLYIKSLNGTVPEKRLTASDFNQQPKSWSGDASHVIYQENIHTETGYDIYMIDTSDNSTPVPLLKTSFNEAHPNISPNGKWMAYISDQPGQYEVFISSFPDGNHRTQISNSGGREPVWNADGNILYYRDYSGDRLMAVSISIDQGLPPEKPEEVLNGTFNGGSITGNNYDVHPDGQNFLMIQTEEFENVGNRINIIHNWSEELVSYFDPKKGNN